MKILFHTTTLPKIVEFRRVKTDFPDGFLKSIDRSPGFTEQKFVDAHHEQSPVSIRLNPEKFHPETFRKVAWHPEGRYLPERPDFTLDPSFHAGAYYVQEASSMSIYSALEEHAAKSKELRVLDLCGAPGGKSTLLASWMEGNGLLVANEVIRGRAGILEENISRWGYSNVIVSNNDPRQFARLQGFFDVILVDAPCSGSGMFRKDPAAMAHWSAGVVEHCAARQQRILNDIWPALKENGLLIYSTCSYSEQEDEEITKWLDSEFEAEILTLKTLEIIPGIIKTSAGYRFYPGNIEGEGFYLSVIRKTTQEDELIWKSSDNSKAVPLQLASWLKDPQAFRVIETHLGASLFPANLIEITAPLLKHLHIIKLGISAGEMKGNSFIPSHDLALSVILNDRVPKINLNKELALRFLKKEALPGEAGKTGYHLMSYENLPLGWGNALPNRINNYLPKSWKIRKEIE